MDGFRVPLATYRLQFNLNFRFVDAYELVPYLHELGISDLYASPRFKARKGSSHGYDVADPLRVNSELGTEEEFEDLVRRLKLYDLGLLLDIVPNHMAASEENPWWMDVLEHGRSSAYARFFDIDWKPEGKLLLPVLGEPCEAALEQGMLTAQFDENGFFLRYYDRRFPLDPKTYRLILEPALARLRAANPEEALAVELAALIELTDRLPHTQADASSIEERRTATPEIKRRLWSLARTSPEARQALDHTLRSINGQDAPAGLDSLQALLSHQPYRLAYWKTALEALNYRRFFDISDLVCLRIEDPEVFATRHAQILQLVQEGKVTGLRIDHIDGLRDPLGYLERLQQAATGSREHQLYVVVEKILGAGEELPEAWPVCGTTGYNFLNALNQVFLDRAGLKALESAFARFTVNQNSFAEVTIVCKKQVMQQLFPGEVRALGRQLSALAAREGEARNLAERELVQALVEVTACLPIYRTYVRDRNVSARDAAYLRKALETAQARTAPAAVSASAWAFLRRVLLLEPPEPPNRQEDEQLRFLMRWQQFTGPVMAKGLEDTACYVHNSLVSLNEVGTDPLRQALELGPESLHRFCAARQPRWPFSLNATSTHDTKRSEDVRARINVLSECPEAWEACWQRWSTWNQNKKKALPGQVVPDANEELLLYQTLVGAWPLESEAMPVFLERLKAYVVKAAREAKRNTSWLEPNVAYETALIAFVESILDSSKQNKSLDDFLRFQRRIACYGAWNALGQVLLKIASPGVPDFYQGTELWDFSLVDPDNRRPVDFKTRLRCLDELKQKEAQGQLPLVRELLESWPNGRIKLYLTWKALNFRRNHSELFLSGEYVPLRCDGTRREHLCAFARRAGEAWAVVVVPRLTSKLVDTDNAPLGEAVWGQSRLRLPPGAPARWLHVFTGETIEAVRQKEGGALPVHAVLRSFPVALLTALPG